MSNPLQPPEQRRRPSVQSILDEIVVTQPPSAIIHEALGSNFPIRVAAGLQAPAPARGRYSSIDTVASEGLSAPRPRMKRIGSDDSVTSQGSEYAFRRENSTARMLFDNFNKVDFQKVGWTALGNTPSRGADHAPGNFV